MKFSIIRFVSVMLVGITTFMNCQTDGEKSKLTEVWDPVPEIVKPGIGNMPPSDAIILLGTDDLSEWEHEDGSSPKWNFCEGVLTVVKKTGLIRTKRKFGDCQLHVEWRTPKNVVGEGQGRGNSGVFLQARYEVQVLDSYNNRTYSNGQAGSIYKQHIPLVNACKGPGEWQSYDIIFTAPTFRGGKLESPGSFTVIHNGVLIQNHAEIKGTTAWIGDPNYEIHDSKDVLTLQDHGNPVSFRNIWIREL